MLDWIIYIVGGFVGLLAIATIISVVAAIYILNKLD
jgi:hypothetical protein